MPFFSIIIPIYKIEKYLDECLQSVLMQTYTDYECILVNDGSPDNCPAMCDEYAKKNERIKVIHKENSGPSDARNTGILQANSKYIVCLDGDDKLTDDKSLINLLNVIQEHKTDVIVNVNLIYFTDSGEKSLINNYDKNINIGSAKKIADTIQEVGIGAGCFFVVNREYLIKNNLFFKKGAFHEDVHWVPRLLFRTKQIAVNHSPFYSYRFGREGSTMTTLRPQRLFNLLEIVDDMLEWSKDEKTYTKEGCDYILKDAMRQWEYCFHLSDEIKQQDQAIYYALCKKMSERLISLFETVSELVEQSKDEKSYIKKDCDSVLERKRVLLKVMFYRSGEIKQYDQEVYLSFCKEMPKGLLSLLEFAGEVLDQLKSEKNYTKKDCEYKTKKAIKLWKEFFYFSSEIKKHDRNVYCSLCKEMSKGLFSLLEIVGELTGQSKDGENYAKEDCDYMLKKAMELWEECFYLSSEIKQQDQEIYRTLCKEMSKKLKTLSKVADKKWHKSVTIIGIENTRLLLKLKAMLKR